MKKYRLYAVFLTLSLVLVSCAYYPYQYAPPDYNTQVGTTLGAGIGALLGQAMGGNTESTIIGMTAGTILGALVGNAADRANQAAIDAAQYHKPVIVYDEDGHAVEAIPEKSTKPNCKKVRKRFWENGIMVKETIEEICIPSSPAEPPPSYYYGWWGWPYLPPGYYYGFPHYRRYYPPPHPYHPRPRP